MQLLAVRGLLPSFLSTPFLVPKSTENIFTSISTEQRLGSKETKVGNQNGTNQERAKKTDLEKSSNNLLTRLLSEVNFNTD